MNRRRAGYLLSLSVAVLSALALTSDRAAAQFRLGGQLSYGTGGIDPALGIGLRGTFGLGLAELDEGGDTALGAIAGVLTLDRFFPDCNALGCAIWEVSGNLVLPLLSAGGFTPYLGTGVALSRFSVDENSAVDPGLLTDTNARLNILGGVRHRGARMTTFGELRKSLGGGDDPFYVSLGVLLGG